MRLVSGFLVAFGIGVFCRLCKIPSPAPQAILGSLLVVAMSAGYVVAGHLSDRKSASAQQVFISHQEHTHASR